MVTPVFSSSIHLATPITFRNSAVHPSSPAAVCDLSSSIASCMRSAPSTRSMFIKSCCLVLRNFLSAMSAAIIFALHFLVSVVFSRWMFSMFPLLQKWLAASFRMLCVPDVVFVPFPYGFVTSSMWLYVCVARASSKNSRQHDSPAM